MLAAALPGLRWRTRHAPLWWVDPSAIIARLRAGRWGYLRTYRLSSDRRFFVRAFASWLVCAMASLKCRSTGVGRCCARSKAGVFTLGLADCGLMRDVTRVGQDVALGQA